MCIRGALRRALLRRPRPDLAEGCPERLDLEFLRHIWRYPERSRPRVLELLAQHGAGERVVHLRSRASAGRFLASLTP